MKRILVGTDGSPPAADALAWAASLARAVDAELVVATVLVPGLAGLEVGEAIEPRSRVAHLLETDWCVSARALVPGLRTVVLDGDPRTALLDAAEAEHADVLVLASGGSGWFPALHLGHVAHAIAHHTTVPLVVVPRDGHAPATGPLLVGIDGSEGSAAAIRWAGDLARALDCEVVAAYAHLGRDLPEGRAALEQRCAEWTAPLTAAGVPTRVVIREGWPPNVINELEAAEEPALVVVGTRGAGGFHDLRLGSVALQLLHHARVPVAVIPQAD